MSNALCLASPPLHSLRFVSYLGTNRWADTRDTPPCRLRTPSTAKDLIREDGACLIAFSPRESDWQAKLIDALHAADLRGSSIDITRVRARAPPSSHEGIQGEAIEETMPTAFAGFLVHARVLLFGMAGSPLFESLDAAMPTGSLQAWFDSDDEDENDCLPKGDCFS